MPRYFFHICDGVDFKDEDGTEFPDMVAAERAGLVLIADYVRDHVADLQQHGALTLTIADEDGLSLATVLLSTMRSPAADGRSAAVDRARAGLI